MKSATPELIALLASKRQFACSDLFTITRNGGDILRYCTTDVSIYWQDETFSCYSVQPSGLRYRIVTGLEADEQTLTLASDRTNMLDGVPFLDAVREGALDGARIKRERAYMDAWATPGPNGLQPIGCITLFTGYVSSIDNITRLSVELRVKSELALLDVSMPRHVWQASCIHTLYDTGCTLDRSLWSVSGAAETGSTDITVNWTDATPAYYWGGVITVTSGQNSGQTRTIKNSNGYQLELSYPLPYTMAVGDTFSAAPGCDHTMNTCTEHFANLDNFRGYPFIPSAETAL